MKKLIKKTALALVAALFAAAPSAMAADAASMPVILTLKTNIYNYQGPNNNFTIYLGSLEKDTEFHVKTGKTDEYVWVDPWTLGTDGDGFNAAIATAVSLSVTETNNIVEIRGDASQLDYIDVHGCYLSDIEFNGNFENLIVFDGSHNELQAIDLSGIPSLQSIDIADNAIDRGANMKIGAHPDLLILSIGINNACDPDLNLRNYPHLQYFSAYANTGLSQVDPTGCPDLVSLVLDVTNVSTVDVSRNAKLDVLNLSNTKVTNIDLSNNPVLGEFYASHEGTFNSGYKLTSIDVSKNPELQYLDLSGNRLTEIDLTKNTRLKLLYLQKNLLSEIDLSNCNNLASVNLSNNLFTFATLPLPQPGWDYYYYRSPLECYFKYKVDEPIDFSSSVIRAPYVDAQGNTITPQTDAVVLTAPRIGEPDVLDPNAGIYTYADGVITFHQALSDSVYVKFTNSVFYDWDLDTQPFMVKTAEDYDNPSTAFSFKPYSSMNGKNVSFKMGLQPVASGVNYPAEVIVNVAGEDVATLGVNSASLPEEDNIEFNMPAAGGEVIMYVTDGFGLSALSMDNIKMQAIDLSEAVDMHTLAVTNANLPSIDMAYNRALVNINLSGNLLTTVDFSPVRGDFEKWNLRNINLSNNNISSLHAQNSIQFTTLDISNNWFSDVNLKYYTGLINLNISGNRLSGTLDLSENTKLQNLDASGNQISSVVFGNSYFESLNLADNNLSFSTLPLPMNGVQYTYAPQKKMGIIAGGASINLSDQNINGATTFTWKYSDNNNNVEASLISLENGVTRFNESLVGKKVYCQMTNATFPDFATQPLTTTDFKVMDKPTNVVATLTPAESGTITIGFGFNNAGANAVYIDWNGDGSQYDEYIYDNLNTAIYRSGTAVAGKTAKIYTYGEPAEVSKLFINNPGSEDQLGSRIKLKDIDLTPMANAEAVDIHNAGLTDGSIKLPASKRLTELVLDGNAFSSQVFKAVDGTTLPITMLVLGNNKYTSFNIADYPSVAYLLIADNQIQSITMPANNSRLIQLNAQNNKLSSINLTGLNNLSELLLSGNNLSELDIKPVKNTLRALLIAGNRFTFATLPKLTEFNTAVFNKYDYFDQQPMTVECKDGIVDLSDQFNVETVYRTDDGFDQTSYNTTYRWFLGNNNSDVYFDYYYEMFVGEELEGPEQNPADPEYSCYDGITKFFYTQKRRVICAMTNPGLSSLILYTEPVQIDKATGVEDVSVDSEDIPVDVFSLSGVCLRRNVLPANALEGLTPGVYIVGGQKVYVK